MHFTEVTPPFHSIALALYRYLSAVPSTLQHAPTTSEPRETQRAEGEEAPSGRPKKGGRVPKKTKASATTTEEGARESDTEVQPTVGEEQLRERELVIEAATEDEQIRGLSSMMEAQGAATKHGDRHDLTSVCLSGPTTVLPPPALPPRERCPICSLPVPFTGTSSEICPNGHSLGTPRIAPCRAGETLTALFRHS